MVHLEPLHRGHRHDGELRDPVTASKADRLAPVVDEDDVDLTSIPRVDQSGTVDHSDSGAEGVPAPGQYQPGVAFGDGDGDTGRYRRPLPGRQGDVDPGLKVDRGVADMCRCGNPHFRIEPGEVSLHLGLGIEGRALDDCKRWCPMTATRLPGPKRRFNLSSMESLGFIDTPAVVESPPGRPGDEPVPSARSLPPAAGTRLVGRGRHVAPTGDPVRDLWDTTVLDAPSITDWQPELEVMRRLVGRDFRLGAWAVLLIMLLVGAGAGYVWMTWSRTSSQAVTASVEESVARLATSLEGLRSVADRLSAADASASLQDISAPLEVEAAGRSLFAELALLPADHPDRAPLADAVESALESASLVREALAFRLALEPALALPELETVPELVEIEVAAGELIAWRSGYETVTGALPAGVADVTLQSAVSVASELASVQSDYLEALGRGDRAGAVQVLGVLRRRLQEVRRTLLADMVEIGFEATRRIDQASAGLS